LLPEKPLLLPATTGAGVLLPLLLLPTATGALPCWPDEAGGLPPLRGGAEVLLPGVLVEGLLAMLPAGAGGEPALGTAGTAAAAAPLPEAGADTEPLLESAGAGADAVLDAAVVLPLAAGLPLAPLVGTGPRGGAAGPMVLLASAPSDPDASAPPPPLLETAPLPPPANGAALVEGSDVALAGVLCAALSNSKPSLANGLRTLKSSATGRGDSGAASGIIGKRALLASTLLWCIGPPVNTSSTTAADGGSCATGGGLLDGAGAGLGSAG
jgi:hypothetical protein